MSDRLATRACEINHARTTAQLRAELASPEASREHHVAMRIHAFMSAAKDVLDDLTPDELRAEMGDIALTNRRVSAKLFAVRARA